VETASKLKAILPKVPSARSSAASSATQTVNVYARHSSGCSKAGEPKWRRCKCAKYLYLLKDGTRKTVSAKTRSWEKAEAKAQEIRDDWTP
jgi:hypothetical protein